MIDLGRDVLVWSGAYVAFLFLLGYAGRRAKKEDTLSDHFLAGRSIGFFVLLLTLFATQYSGNSMSGFPGKTYREGFAYFMSVAFMIGIVTGYILFAPRLLKLSRARKYITPTDYLSDRFRSPLLDYLSVAIFTYVLCNFMVAQLMALGHAFSGVTGNQIPFALAVIGGGAVVLIYELMGGMRAVAWTDALQGIILVLGLIVMVILLQMDMGSPAAIVEAVNDVAPEKLANPDLETCLLWISSFLLLGLGAPLYPQAIQRIYAAGSLGHLKKALVIMALLPLVATTTVILIGAAGIALFPDLDRIESEKVTFLVLGHLVNTQPLAYYPTLIVMIAVLAAIMSTADSCLLSLTSIFTKDLTARVRGMSGRHAERLTRVAPFISLIIMVVLVSVAVRPRTTIWGLLVIKFEVLIQLSPAFVLGTLHDRGDPQAYSAREILLGLAAGLATFAVLYAAGLNSLHGLHAGTVGMAANYLVVFAAHALGRRPSIIPD